MFLRLIAFPRYVTVGCAMRLSPLAIRDRRRIERRVTASVSAYDRVPTSEVGVHGGLLRKLALKERPAVKRAFRFYIATP